MFCAASRARARSTSISPAWAGRAKRGSRAVAGTSRNNSSTEETPILASMALRSSVVRGKKRIDESQSFHEFRVLIFCHELGKISIIRNSHAEEPGFPFRVGIHLGRIVGKGAIG